MHTTTVQDLLSYKALNFEEAYNYFKAYKNWGFFEHVIQDSLFPRKEEKIKINPVLPSTENLQGEFAFIIFLIIKNNKAINNFLEQEYNFQQNLLLENYQECLNIIKYVENNICKSLWGIESKFNILQKIGGIEENWKYNNELCKKTENDLITLLANFYSKKAEDEVSVLSYFNEVNLLTRNLQKKEREYVSFILGEKSHNYEEFTFIINSHSNSSIIDLYYFTLSIINHLSSNKQNYKFLNKTINILSSDIKDERIKRIKEINSFSTEKIEIIVDLNILILNEYSKGNYTKALEICKKQLGKRPEILYLYEIYVKCLLQLKLDFVKTNINSTIDNILEDLYAIFSKSNNYYLSKDNLLKISLSNSRVNLYIQIYSFISGYTGSSSAKALYNEYFIYCDISNPQSIHLNYHNEKKTFKGDIKKNLSLYINYLIFKNNYKEISNLNIPEKKKELYIARVDFSKNRYTENSEKLLEKLYKLEYDNYSKEEILNYFIGFLVNQNNLSRIFDIVVDSYFENKFLIERFNLEILIKLLINNNYNLSYVNINLPIFFYLGNVDSYYQYVSLEMFLGNESIGKASELISQNFNEQKLLIVLEKIATIETLNNFYLEFNNEDEIVNERIKILNILKSISPTNLSYDEEINLLKQKASLKKLLTNINNGRIYFNFQKTIENNRSNYLVSFNRAKHIMSYSKTNDLDFLDTNELFKIDTNILIQKYLSQLSQDSTLINKAEYISFKTLYIEILENYLFSNEYGLNGILSTRFRHGEIENKIRNIFSSNNLISTKDVNSEYTEIPYWNMYEFLGAEIKLPEIQGKIKLFSEKIDDLIGYVVYKKVQINSNRNFNNDAALFQFINTESFIWLLFKDFENNDFTFEQFIDYLGSSIRLQTEQLLKNTINFFNNDLKNRFLEIINTFQNEVNTVINTKDILFDFNQKVNFIKTSVEKELFEISKWFKINNTIDSTSLDFKTIIDLAMDSFNLEISYKVNDYSQSFFDGAYYYLDILRILVDNAIKYSQLPYQELNIIFEITREDVTYKTSTDNIIRQNITITIQNNFSDRLDNEKLNECFESITSNWNNDLTHVDEEGGTGFKKIGKMLKYDIKSINSTLKFNIQNNTISIILNYEI
ncbi:hypothetical protein [Chryseobacterium sp. JAH]|uniref:hypothetical protein n=1 Tax=Chryseobacterium sp. JAH TaxID=1742858 RepID=UPI000741138F|nr:hypothetical protein [Chryseobacterium sp. JAH]KUJ51736.1 hypothetical protein AR685_08830 [Chryseobacterium sp. JAH]